MSQYWENIAAKTDRQYVAEEFESTASRLLAEQVLYYADRHSRMSYGMIERFEREFKHVLSQVGPLCVRDSGQRQGGHGQYRTNAARPCAPEDLRRTGPDRAAER
jgi:hypothetical protein